MLAGLARLAHGRPKWVLAVAGACAVAAGAFGGSVAERLHPYGADDPASESVKADRLVERASGLEGDPGLIAIVRTPGGVRSEGARRRVEAVARELRAEPDVGRVTTFYGSGDRAMVSRDGRATYLVGSFKPVTDKAKQEAAERLEDRLERHEGVVLGGSATAQVEVNRTVESDLRRAELMAFPLLFLLSFVFFRSLVAAALPMLVGALAIVGTFAGLRLASEMTEVSIFALNLTVGLGLGLAIDYSLFVVSRYREELARAGPGLEALRATLQTAGRTVLFSSLTVAAALASLLVFPQRFLYSMGLGGMMVALIAAAVALVVLPAVLALLGPRVNALAPRRLQLAAERDARPLSAGLWYRLARFVTRRPGRVALTTAVLLVALGIPFLGIKFTVVDATVLPPEASAHVADRALEREFLPHSTTPVKVVAEGASPAELRDYRAHLAGVGGVAGVSEPRPAGRDVATLDVVSRTRPLSGQSEDLVREIRAEHPPFRAAVTGWTAQFSDQKASYASHLPYAFAIVVGATMVVLFLMTGSLVLPLKQLAMNILALGATFGILVTIFQDGRLEGLLDYRSQGALELTVPVLLFAVAFGLSTDYGVFLLSRIKEARDRGASDSEAVAIGLERTGRIVTAAALLFSVAIGAFATSKLVFIKQNGVGTALAVMIDATIVRALLVPALMELLGRRNWWAPRPLRWLYGRLGLSEVHGPAAPEPARPA